MALNIGCFHFQIAEYIEASDGMLTGTNMPKTVPLQTMLMHMFKSQTVDLE